MALSALGGAVGPTNKGFERSLSTKNQSRPAPLPEADNFRCLLLGDSQTTDPSATRIRTQTHRWDAPIIGELVCAGSVETGFLVNNGSAGISGLNYRNVSLEEGWGDGGSPDFFAESAAEWFFENDIPSIGARIGRYQLRFGSGNSHAPWREMWGVGNTLVARIAVRTGPNTIPAIETRAERGGVVDIASRVVHTLDSRSGIQILEQIIPVGFNPQGQDVGVGLFLPSGSLEEPGQVLQVLGVLIERVAPDGTRLPGTIIAYQGRGGWSIEDHINKLSNASRSALAYMIQANTVLIALGHNAESGGIQRIEPNARLLVQKCLTAFSAVGLPRPRIIYLAPWMIDSGFIQAYLANVENVYSHLAQENRADLMISYQRLFDDLRPDVYDPVRYQLDVFGTHPGNESSAVRLAQDLFEMLFEGRRD